MENEIFKDIPQYEGKYQVSNYGRVWNVKYQRYLKPIAREGRATVTLYAKNGKAKSEKVHRLVAMAFIPNPNHFPQINHKDENPLNNYVGNLEWCTQQYNLAYGTARKRIALARSKKVLQFTREGKLVAEYNSVCEASEKAKVDKAHISNCCLGQRKSAGDYLWKFADEKDLLKQRRNKK